MAKPRFLVSLTTNNNDYQMEQAQSADQAARKLGVEVQIIFADNDAINQSTEVLKAIQSPENVRPNAIVFEPVGGTALPQVAQAAANAGIAWAVLNRDAAYIAELRKTAIAPIFCLSSNHIEIGRIQGRQFAALLPQGGSILYIQGPSENSAAKERIQGMRETKPANIQATVLKAQWTEESSTRSVRSWLKLVTSQRAPIDLVAAQDDSMAIGARKAFEELTNESEKERWLKLPYTGCDGLPNTGQAWVREGLLTATVFVPPNAGQAIELVFHSIQSKRPVAERVLTVPISVPPLKNLRPVIPQER
ncbi:MAG: sugar ABC transporter substrate-binding protein [Acidobacteriota bacterium]|nr:sugar ABC transporter substrate-binding protein [Acidobacteriota bacterium]